MGNPSSMAGTTLGFCTIFFLRYMLGNFFMIFFRLLLFFFSKFNFFKKIFHEHSVSNRLDQDQTQHYVGPALDPNCLQKYKHTTAAFYQGVYYFMKTKLILRERKIFGTSLITCDPLIYIVNYPILLLLWCIKQKDCCIQRQKKTVSDQTAL